MKISPLKRALSNSSAAADPSRRGQTLDAQTETIFAGRLTRQLKMMRSFVAQSEFGCSVPALDEAGE